MLEISGNIKFERVKFWNTDVDFSTPPFNQNIIFIIFITFSLHGNFDIVVNFGTCSAELSADWFGIEIYIDAIFYLPLWSAATILP